MAVIVCVTKGGDDGEKSSGPDDFTRYRLRQHCLRSGPSLLPDYEPVGGSGGREENRAGGEIGSRRVLGRFRCMQRAGSNPVRPNSFKIINYFRQQSNRPRLACGRSTACPSRS